MSYKKKIGIYTVSVELEVLNTLEGTFSVAYPSDPTEKELDDLVRRGENSIRLTAEGNNNATKKDWEETAHFETGAATFTIVE